KVAELQGIRVLNINELCNALRPVVLPGEAIRVFVLKEGKEAGQGVAYLDDGTMIVVDNARRYIGKNIDVVVTSVLQTTAGRMIFTRLKEETEREKWQCAGGSLPIFFRPVPFPRRVPGGSRMDPPARRSTVAVVPAAGRGLRMGGSVPKQFLAIGGLPLVVHSLRILQAAPSVDAIVLAVPQGDIDYCRADIVKAQNFDKVTQVVAGG